MADLRMMAGQVADVVVEVIGVPAVDDAVDVDLEAGGVGAVERGQRERQRVGLTARAPGRSGPRRGRGARARAASLPPPLLLRPSPKNLRAR